MKVAHCGARPYVCNAENRPKAFPVTETALPRRQAGSTLFVALGAVSFCHLLNDLAQSLLPAIYPILKSEFTLTFGQIGLLTLIYQGTASLLQPMVGLYTDNKPQPYSLPFGMGCTLLGLLTFAFAPSFAVLLAGAALLGFGSAVFHPESSRLARSVSGGAHGLAQSLFQVGGNLGTSLGPLLAAFVILPHGQRSLAWFALVALAGMIILLVLGRWYENHRQQPGRASSQVSVHRDALPSREVRRALAILIALMFSKFFYMASITSYYIFYLIHRFHVTTEMAQIDLFVFLAASAAGTFFGGPIGDRFGRRTVIWISIVGVLPFTLILPYVGLAATVGLSVAIGLILSSAFSAIVVYAQELMPGRVGMVSGLFFGFAFGIAGVGAAILGVVADLTSIDFIYRVCAFLPAIGLLTAFLPDVEARLRIATID
jgi:MFS transporter, FSR family, fosmidomycin resistance protein